MSGGTPSGRALLLSKVNLASAGTLLLTLVFSALPAHAVNCSQEELVFWANRRTDTSAWRTGYGTANEIRNSFRYPFSAACGDPTWTTAHMRLGGDTGHWVEAGWLWRWDYFAGVIYVRWFTEWGKNFDTIGYNEGGMPSCVAPSDNANTTTWIVANISGGTNWRMRLRCEDGTPDSVLGSDYTSTGYSSGLSMGETGRGFGDAAQDMSDYHKALRWKTSSGSWSDWSKPQCFYDNAVGWQGNYLSATSYSVIKGTAGC